MRLETEKIERGLLETYKNVEVLVTTTTPTGSKILLDKMGTRVKLNTCLSIYLYL